MNKCPFWYEWDRIGGVFRFLSCGGEFFRFRCMTPPSPLCYCVGFRCLGARFCAESDRRGAVFRFLFWFGVFFTGRRMTLPSPLLVVWVFGLGAGWLGFFSELPRFFLGIGSGWSGFQLPFVVGRVLQAPMHNSPSRSFRRFFRLLYWSRWIFWFRWRTALYDFIFLYIFFARFVSRRF